MMASFRLVAIAKNEASNIPFWVFHHLSVGFDSIDLYINNTDDNSVEILECISGCGYPVRVFDGDSLYSESRSSGEDFQFSVYKSSLSEFSPGEYICFLDLDEFLVGPSLNSNLSDIACLGSTDFASVSFRWMLDLPSENAPSFAPVLSSRMPLRKGNPFKSIGLIGRVEFVNSHMFSASIDPGTGDFYSRYYSTGARLSSSVKKGFEGVHNDLEHSSLLDPWFILHRIHGSECEYLASLMRGRGHKSAAVDGNSDVLKNNRRGYKTDASFEDKMFKVFDPIELSVYYDRYQNFLRKCSLEQRLDIARQMVRDREFELRELLASRPSLRAQYRKQLSGTSLA